MQRYGGADRYATSLAVAETLLADAGGVAEWAVLVSGQSWTDAVVAGSLAGALSAPVLLTPPGELRPDTAAFLDNAGIESVIIVGSADAPGVSDAVASSLSDAGYSTERVAGTDRYSTGVAVARRLVEILAELPGAEPHPGAMGDLGPTAIVASGEVFVDALVSGPVSAYGHHPVLLTPAERLHPDVGAYLHDAGVEHVVLMGGTAAVDASVERALEDLGLAVTRLSGATRFDTAFLMAELVRGRYSDDPVCFGNAHVGLARARVPFDSFSAAPLLAHRCASLLLTDPTKTNTATRARLSTAAASGTDALQVHVFGGSAAVSASVLDAYFVEEPTPAQPVSTRSACGSDGSARVQLAVVDLIENVTWNSDCSRMAWTNTDRELWVANGDGSAQQRLLRDFGKLKWPVWSPDGSRIAFSTIIRDTAGASEHIYVINADGSGRIQVTHGDAANSGPTWSPDGERLAFGRTSEVTPTGQTERVFDTYVVIAHADGGNETPLLQGGSGETSPSWSPDGRRIAYFGQSVIDNMFELWVMNTDGSDARFLTVADRVRGASWSPDGTRIAVYRRPNPGEVRGAEISVIDLTGATEHTLPLDESVLAEYYFPSHAPQWSPDGRRLFFHTAAMSPYRYQLPAQNWAHVVEAPRRQGHFTPTCRPKSEGGIHTAGFPLPDWARSSTGTLRVAVLFVDFPDAVPTHSTREESNSSLGYFERYLELSSGGRLDVVLVPHHVWLRAENTVSNYQNEHFYNGLLDHDISDHAIQLADDDFDFSNIDVVLTVMPSTLFGGGGNEGSNITADGNTMRAIRINHGYRQGGYSTRPGSDVRLPNHNPWGRTAVHEFMHSLGLADLYWKHTLGFRLWPIGDPLAPPPLPEGESWTLIEFGMMQLNGYDRVIGWNLKDRRLEMLAWSKWQLGWLDPDQVECITSDSARVWLRPAAEPEGGVAMAAVQLSANSAIVVESRRLVGYDRSTSYTRASVEAGDLDPQYLAEGVLVYIVSSLRREHPVALAQDNGRGYLSRFPLLGVDDSVNVAGYTITVTGDNGTEHTVSIRKND